MESRCSFLTTALLVFALFSRNILEQIFAHSMCMGIFCTISTVRTTALTTTLRIASESSMLPFR